MARELWAKVYVNLRHHPKIIGRPDADFRLWVGLILHAKEHCPDCVVRDMTAADMRGSFGIKAPVKVVEAGLKYFIRKGMLVEVPGGLLIRDMAERQAKAGDTPEAHAERQRQYRLRVADDVRTNGAMTSPQRNGMTSPDVSARDAEVDLEKDLRERDLEELGREKISDPGGGTNGKAPAHYSEPWDAALLKRVQTALGLSDLDHGWGLFVGQSLQEPAEKRHAAAREFLHRNCAREGKDWPYLLAMIRNGAGKRTQPAVVVKAEPVSAERKAQVDRELEEIRSHQA